MRIRAVALPNGYTVIAMDRVSVETFESMTTRETARGGRSNVFLVVDTEDIEFPQAEEVIPDVRLAQEQSQ